jgi:hypothetical protein
MNRGNGKTRRVKSRMAAAVYRQKRPDPWELVWGQPYIDATQLATAIEGDLKHTPHPDFRTRLLVRDSARALMAFWGRTRFERWIAASSVGERIRALLE